MSFPIKHENSKKTFKKWMCLEIQKKNSNKIPLKCS